MQLSDLLGEVAAEINAEKERAMTPEERRSFAIVVHERSVGGGDPETRNHNETALTL